MRKCFSGYSIAVALATLSGVMAHAADIKIGLPAEPTAMAPHFHHRDLQNQVIWSHRRTTRAADAGFLAASWPERIVPADQHHHLGIQAAQERQVPYTRTIE
jgi:hypothetical protein